MICPTCGTENAAGNRFCDECGTTLSAVCPNCGEPHRPGAKFCANCGTNLAATEVGQQAQQTPEAAAGALAERRFVTVLFVDLVGFTPFAEERDAELVRETLDRYFGIARLAVERHGGTIEKFIGDAVMAVWGTPTAHEDDAERAVRAAMELLDGVQGLGEDISARAGIVTGEAAVTIGAEGQGMVAGDLVNTASRLQSVAPSGVILVSATTMNAASAAIVFEPVGAQELKGKTAPVEAYRALRVVANRGGQMRSEGLEAPFVGREEELRLLKDQLHATTRDGRARLVSISGPAGIGKSRLAWEFEKYIDGVVETIYWHRGRSPAYGEGVTFWALGEMVRRRAELAEGDDEATTRERIAATVERWVANPDEHQWVASSLLALLGLDPPPSGGRDVLFAAWRVFFEGIAAQGTTVLVFEDIQWADSGLLDFIDSILEWSKNKPLLVVTLARPDLYDRRPNWGAGHRLLTAMPLDPLSEASMRELLAGLVPGLPDQAVEAIIRRADGIPLYAVETVRMLVAEGRVEVVDGVYRPTGNLDELAVPETLRSLIASRLDGLEPTDRSLLQDASVIGQRFSTASLAAVSGMSADEVEPPLRDLVRRELLDLEIDPRSPERGQYGFVQSLIREVAYGTLARRERRSRHLAAARYYEQLGDEELAGVLASHYLAAYEASTEGPEADALAVQARLALQGAAQRAAALGGHEQAVSYAEAALKITTNPSERASLLILAAESANVASRLELAESMASEALDIYRGLTDRASLAYAVGLLGRIFIDSGDLRRAIEAMESGLAEVGESDDDATAEVLANLSRAYMRSDQNQKAVETADRALNIAEHRNLVRIVAEALINKGSAMENLSGRRRESAAILELAIRLAHDGGWTEVELRGLNNLTAALVEVDPRRALDVIHETIELSRRAGQRVTYNWQVGTAGMYAQLAAEDWDRSLALIDEALSVQSISDSDRTRLVAVSGAMRIIRGELSEDAFQEIERLIAAGGESQALGTLLHDRALYHLLAGRYDQAIEAALASTKAWSNFIPQYVPTAVVAAVLAGDEQKAREAATNSRLTGKRLAARGGHAYLDERHASGPGRSPARGWCGFPERHREPEPGCIWLAVGNGSIDRRQSPAGRSRDPWLGR